MRKAVVTVLLLMSSGCASIVSGGDVATPINSTPDRADFIVVDENNTERHRGVTPATVSLPRSGGYFNGRDYVKNEINQPLTPVAVARPTMTPMPDYEPAPTS